MKNLQEAHLDSIKIQEQQLMAASRDLSQRILAYSEQEEELKLRIQELQVKVLITCNKY